MKRTLRACIALLMLGSLYAQQAEPVPTTETEEAILAKTIGLMRLMKTIQWNYTVEEQGSNAEWTLIERHWCATDLAERRKKDVAIVRDNDYAIYRRICCNADLTRSVDRICPATPQLTIPRQFLEKGSGSISASGFGWRDAALTIFTSPYGITTLHQLLEDPKISKQIVKQDAAAHTKHLLVQVNDSLRLVIDRSTGMIVEKAHEINGADHSCLRVLESACIEGRQLPILFTMGGVNVPLRRYRIDPASIIIDAPIKQETFDFIFPSGAYVVDNVHGRKVYQAKTAVDLYKDTPYADGLRWLDDTQGHPCP